MRLSTENQGKMRVVKIEVRLLGGLSKREDGPVREKEGWSLPRRHTAHWGEGVRLTVSHPALGSPADTRPLPEL